MKADRAVLIVLLLLFIGSDSYAAGNKTAPVVYEFLPGGTHFYEGNNGKGLAFLTSEVFLLTAGIMLESRKGAELNIPLMLASQVYTIDKFDYLRRRLPDFPLERTRGNTIIKYDTSPLSELMTAPFRPAVFFSPLVLCWAVLGVFDGMYGYPEHTATWHDIEHARFFNRTLGRDSATFWYEMSTSALSWGAAVSEEMVFRGVLLPKLDYLFGKRAGLVSSSLVFGLLHLFNPDIDKPLYFVGQATAAGFAFGYQVQRNQYRIDKAIAAHFWYNIISMTTTWLVNPKENPLGFKVRFTL